MCQNLSHVLSLLLLVSAELGTLFGLSVGPAFFKVESVKPSAQAFPFRLTRLDTKSVPRLLCAPRAPVGESKRSALGWNLSVFDI